MDMVGGVVVGRDMKRIPTEDGGIMNGHQDGHRASRGIPHGMAVETAGMKTVEAVGMTTVETAGTTTVGAVGAMKTHGVETTETRMTHITMTIREWKDIPK